MEGDVIKIGRIELLVTETKYDKGTANVLVAD